MKILLGLLLWVMSIGGGALAEQPTLKPEDLDRLVGARWVGMLTYLDYGKNKKVSMPVTLEVTRFSADRLTWTFDMRYPDEPQANNVDEIALSGDGRTLDGETVLERSSPSEGMLKIVTEKSGTDNKKAAMLRYTYLISATAFSIRKEIKYDGAAEFFERNEYSWKR